MRTHKKALALLLASSMLLGMLPMGALAAEEVEEETVVESPVELTEVEALQARIYALPEVETVEALMESAPDEVDFIYTEVCALKEEIVTLNEALDTAKLDALVALFTPDAVTLAAGVSDCPGGDACQHEAATSSKHYDTFEDAMSNGSGKTVTILKDITDVSNFTLGRYTYTINLNNHSIGFAQGQHILLNASATLNLIGVGKIYEQAPEYSPIVVNGVSTGKRTTLNVGKDVTLEGFYGAFIDHSTYKDKYITVNVEGTLLGSVDTNGKLGAGIYINGKITGTNVKQIPQITLTDTAKVSGPGHGIYAAGYAKWDITGSEITGPTGIEIRAGEMNISGNAKITGTATTTSATGNDNGSTVIGAGIAISQHTTKLPIKVTISDSEIIGATALYECNLQNSSAEDLAKIEIIVNGGTFKGNTQSVYSEDFKGFISNGNFSSSVQEYVVDTLNAELEKSSGETPFNYYTDFATAFEAADPGDTITLLGNGNTDVPPDFITLDHGYNNVQVTVDVESGVTFTLPTLTRENYMFGGWQQDSSDVPSYTHSGTGGENVTLVAQWNGNPYTLTFDINGGTEAPASQTVTFGSTYGDLPTPTRTGYTFVGWFTEADAGAEVSADTAVSTASDHTLTAQWTANQYTLTLDPAGGMVIPATQAITFDSTYGDLPTPTRTGYTFNGWFTAAEGGTEVTADTTVSTASDHTLYAQWNENVAEHVEVASGAPVIPDPDITGKEAEVVQAMTKTTDALKAPDAVKETDLGEAAKAVATDKETMDEAFQQAETNSAFQNILTSAGEDAETTIVVEHYMDIQVVDAEVSGTQTSVTLDITPRVNIKATTDPGNMVEDGTAPNTVTLVKGQELEVTEPVTITLPAIFGTSDNLYVKHEAKKGTFYYKATANDDGTITFVNPNGFSLFTLLADSRTVTGNFGGESKTLTLADVNQTLSDNYTTPSGKRFDGWQFEEIDGAFTTLTDDLLTQLVAASNGSSITATPTFVDRLSSGGSSGGSGPATYPVSLPDKVDHGTVTVSPKSASKGETVTITVTPDEGYELSSLTVTDKNGNEIKLTDKGEGSFTFPMPASKVTVAASFRPAEPQPQIKNPFIDVHEGDYFYDAVLWAADTGVTTGTTETTFTPGQTVTRAQMVTFLWRSHGSPKVTGTNPFTDVSPDAYYYDAVLWAVESGVTNGTSATTFSPNDPLTRAHAVTFLWRDSGSPAAAGHSFDDVADGLYYTAAVAWAVSEGITVGTGDNRFSPDLPVPRAQAVTLLYRAQK